MHLQAQQNRVSQAKYNAYCEKLQQRSRQAWRRTQEKIKVTGDLREHGEGQEKLGASSFHGWKVKTTPDIINQGRIKNSSTEAQRRRGASDSS